MGGTKRRRTETMKRLSLLGLAVVALFAPGPQRADAQVVSGQVLDAASGEPIPGVRLRLLSLDSTLVNATDSDESGAFELRAREGGIYSVSAERLGYMTYQSDLMSVVDRGRVNVRVRLGVEAIPLTPFVVIADNPVRPGRVGDFEGRRDDPSLGGFFVGREEIERRPLATPTQLLQTLPSVDVLDVQVEDNPRGLDRGLIYLPGTRGGSLLSGRCLAQVFVNGVPYRQTQDGDSSVDDLLAGARIVGIELYPRASSAPPGFAGSGECGVVMYWTEEPGANSDNPWGFKRIFVGAGFIVGVLIYGFTR